MKHGAEQFCLGKIALPWRGEPFIRGTRNEHQGVKYVVFEREAREYLFSHSFPQRTHSCQLHNLLFSPLSYPSLARKVLEYYGNTQLALRARTQVGKASLVERLQLQGSRTEPEISSRGVFDWTIFNHIRWIRTRCEHTNASSSTSQRSSCL